ncbi:MAG: plasmid pRiA4b ORF-3 family protein [Methanosphaera stadtmanae]|nr:plasmid pRiA4b ORF-3 family protein [Methanosphaera stadtmanae]
MMVNILKAYDIKVRLDKIRPIHWRDLIIPAGISFHDLYYIIQVVYGFNYNHDYKFTFKDLDIVIEGLGEGTPVVYIKDLDDFYLSFLYNLGEYFIIDEFLEVYDKIKLEIHTRDKWEFTIEIKKVIESEYSYPIIKRFKGDYNPVEMVCGKYDFMDMLYLLDHPENRDKEEFSRADAYMEDLQKFNMSKCQ